MSWTDERIDRLKAMWAEGSTASQIAEDLGGVSRNAVIGKAHRLGLESRPSPVKSGEEKEKKVKAAAAPAATQGDGEDRQIQQRGDGRRPHRLHLDLEEPAHLLDIEGLEASPIYAFKLRYARFVAHPVASLVVHG